jgi:hypothetical protein
MYLAVDCNVLDARMWTSFVSPDLLQASISLCRRDHTAELAVASEWNVKGQNEI